MKTIPSDKSSRCWTVADIPQPDPRDLGEFEIYVNYTAPGGADKGIPLDAYVVPLFKLAPRLLEVVNLHVMHGLATMGLTPSEINEVKRLSGDHTIKRK